MTFFKEIRHYFRIFFGFKCEFLVALNARFTSIIEKGLIQCRALLDSGAGSSYASAALLDRLGKKLATK